MSQPWMPFYVGDYLADTSHLTTIEHGAYLLLIMHYWRVGSLPKDERQLQRITRMSNREWRESKANLLMFFDEEMQHSRIENELEKTKNRVEKRRISGSMGGTAKALKTKKSGVANASILLEQTASKTLAKVYYPQPQPQSESSKDKDSKCSTDPSFADFWSAYPRKTGKGAAEKSWAAALRKAPPAEILAGLKRHVFSTEPQYIPHPATWLNQRRWEDEPAAPRMTLSQRLALEAEVEDGFFPGPRPGELEG
jgi:uncharacterized protein YdaU (DUF1376 family)